MILDGAHNHLTGRAAYGVVVRNDSDAMIFAFSSNIGNCNFLRAELWGILKGLTIARDRGFNYIVVESDSKIAIKLITYGCPTIHSNYNLVQQIKEIVDSRLEVTFSHIFREANQTTDALAKAWDAKCF
ncbi:Putative ribonuclease H protein [Glycine soja]|uniref:Putative ribonuclease H protein n=1 Tax=Glycine soja TaxID=3848 RepID=A0A0B2P8W3_GLYSO|nr:Putative ribonuclease H protein [Glycine soja]